MIGNEWMNVFHSDVQSFDQSKDDSSTLGIVP